MKFLYFTDTHYRGTNPINRLDDFPLTLENKTREIFQIAKDENVDYILHGGDLFDRPDTSISVASTFVKIFMESPCPIYIISGNHDIYGHNPETVNRTMLGFLCDLGIMNLLDNKKILLKGDVNVQISGSPYKYGIDEKNNIKSYMVDEVDNEADYSIHLVHGFLMEKPFIEGINFTLISDIFDTKADITLCGHYHLGFKTVVHDGKYFINPGSVIRISNSILEIKRRPKILIIELKDKISIKEVYLKSAQPGELVLDRSQIENAKSKRAKAIEFEDIINTGTSLNFERRDVFKIINSIANKENIPENVKNETLRRVTEAQMGVKN